MSHNEQLDLKIDFRDPVTSEPAFARIDRQEPPAVLSPEDKQRLDEERELARRQRDQATLERMGRFMEKPIVAGSPESIGSRMIQGTYPEVAASDIQ